jgi:NAD(P)-dependent dehydrogenase (short-subunit alcohol dehydrogenase family)
MQVCWTIPTCVSLSSKLRCLSYRERQRATEISYSQFAHHLHTNTIGPIIAAQRLLATGLPIGTIIFMSSDSGSAANFRDFEDGFGAYAASKAALNQMLRVHTHLPPVHLHHPDTLLIIAWNTPAHGF